MFFTLFHFYFLLSTKYYKFILNKKLKTKYGFLDLEIEKKTLRNTAYLIEVLHVFFLFFFLNNKRSFHVIRRDLFSFRSQTRISS